MMWREVHCAMCSFLNKERDEQKTRRARKLARRARRLRKQQQRVEAAMAKKKMAPKKVVKKSKLKKKTTKADRAKVGRKWFWPGQQMVDPKSLLGKVMHAFRDADDNVMGQNELIDMLVKKGLKADGKKTPKKLVTTIIRNMSRVGLLVKDRGRKKAMEDLEPVGGPEEDDEDEDESDEDEDDGDESDSEDEDAADDDDEEDSDGDDEDDEDEKPKKKKVVKKKASGKKKKSKK
jgi:hypothetical protein